MTPRCETHGVYEPCPGCRADLLAERGERARVLAEQGVPRWQIGRILDGDEPGPDARSAAAGEDA